MDRPFSDDNCHRLFDAAGRQWHEGPASATIPTTKLPAGVYLLQLSSSQISHTIKLTINR